MSESQKSFKNFYKSYRNNQVIQSDYQGLIDSNKQPIALKLSLISLENIQLVHPSECLRILSYCTLFNERTNKFFGRTIKSKSPKVTGQSGSYQIINIVNINYLSQFIKGTTSVVVEFQFVKLASDGQLQQKQILGYVKIDPSYVQNLLQVKLVKGTTMDLMRSNKSEKLDSKNELLRFEIKIDPQFNQLANLIPTSVLIEENDIIPGLLSETIQHAGNRIQLVETNTLQITNISIKIPSDFEQLLLTSVIDSFEQNLRIPIEKKDLFITERVLQIVFHNSWTFVNRNGESNQCVLNDIKQTGQTNQHQILEFHGIIQVDEVFNHPHTILCFQLIYQVSYKNRDSFKFNIGYLPFLLQDEIITGYHIDNYLILGPGKNIFNHSLLDLDLKKRHISLQCSINPNSPIQKIQNKLKQNNQNDSYNQNSQSISDRNFNNYDVGDQQLYSNLNSGRNQYQEVFGNSDQNQNQQIKNNVNTNNQLIKNNDKFQTYPKEYNNQVQSNLKEQNNQVINKDKNGNVINQNQVNNYQTNKNDQNFNPNNKQQNNYSNNNQSNQKDFNILQNQQNNLLNQPRNTIQNQITPNIPIQSSTFQQQRDVKYQAQPTKNDLGQQQYSYQDQKQNDQPQMSLQEQKKYLEQQYLEFERQQQQFEMEKIQMQYKFQEMTHQLQLQQQMQIQTMPIQSAPNQFLLQQMEAFRAEQQSLLAQKTQEIEEMKKLLYSLKQNHSNNQNTMYDMPNGDFKAISGVKDKDFGNLVGYVKGTKEISRADKVYLMQQGIKGLLDNNKDNEQIDLEKEKNDRYNCAVFLIQFIGIHFEVTIKPNRLFFTVNLYDLPQFKTNNLIYDNSASKFKALHKDFTDKQERDNSEATYKFEIEPSSKPYQFTEYLYDKTMGIDLWDADSQMMFGSVKVKLRNLLRQGKDVQTVIKEYDILDPNYQGTKGSLQLLIKNQGFFKVKQDNQSQSGTLNNKKIISTNALQIPYDFYQSNEDQYMNEDERIKERIQRHKMLFLKDQQNISHADSSVKHKQINQIQFLLYIIRQYKLDRKKQYITQAVQSFVSEERNLYVQFGVANIYPYDIINNSDEEQAFIINFSDPDDKIKEIFLINDPEEWKHLVQSQNYPVPPEWDMITSNNVFILKGNEKVTILLKFLTYRNSNVDKELEFIPNSEFIMPRKIRVVCNLLNGKTTQAIILNVKPQGMIIDHIFRYFEKSNQRVTIQLPSLYFLDDAPFSKPFLHCTLKNAFISWINDSEIQVQFKTQDTCTMQTFNILAFDDKHQLNLKGNWLIEVHAINQIYIRTEMGQQFVQSIQIAGDYKQRKCKLYSSDPKTVYFEKPFNNQFQLNPGKYTLINVLIRSFKEEPFKVQINCVDSQSEELLYSSFLFIETEIPQVSRVFDMSVAVGKESHQKFNYQNKLNESAIFKFYASHPDIIHFQDQKVSILAGKQEQIKIKITPSKEGLENIFIFAEDDSLTVFECLLLKLQTTIY